ncbi:MAG: glycosyltransferase family 2 protein, partial [Deltaproteobacteria bacterium]|nr:glycosyltransferase family 2 protein [Deltaproteobacteria bacterium]
MVKLAQRERPQIDFSVIITCFFEEQSIDIFYERLSNTLKKLGRSYEIIFINDGSTDKTFEKLRRIFDSDNQVTAVIDLFKNTGQANAKTPGIMIAKGKAMVAIDSDLQLDPEELSRLVSVYDKGYDIVSGYRKKRKDTLFRKLPSKIANAIMRKASGTKLRDFGCTFKIYDMRLIHAFEFGPLKPWRSVPVIAQAARTADVPVSHHSRPFRQSGWTFRKLFAYNMDNLVNLSERPFQILGVLCLGIALVGIFRLAAEMIFPISILPLVTPGLLLNVIVIGILAILAVLA